MHYFFFMLIQNFIINCVNLRVIEYWHFSKVQYFYLTHEQCKLYIKLKMTLWIIICTCIIVLCSKVYITYITDKRGSWKCILWCILEENITQEYITRKRRKKIENEMNSIKNLVKKKIWIGIKIVWIGFMYKIYI